MAKTCLPQHRQIEHTFDENDARGTVELFPGEQAALRAGKESMDEGGSDTAAVEVDDAAVLAAGEDDAPVEGVTALGVEKPRRRSKSKE